MLSPAEIEDILERFRIWLQETSEELDHPGLSAAAEHLRQPPGSNGSGRLSPASGAGMLELTESFIALRHETKLQTKGLRGLHEKIQSETQAMEKALAELEQARADQIAAIEAARTNVAGPLVNALLDVDEAVSQAVKTIAKSSSDIDATRACREQLLAELEDHVQRLPKWKRALFKSTWVEWRTTLSTATPASDAPQGAPAPDETLDGLQMLQARVRRALSQLGVEPLECVGQTVDPHTMRVVEVIHDPNVPPETVLQVLRTGYMWEGRVLRAAEVCASK